MQESLYTVIVINNWETHLSIRYEKYNLVDKCEKYIFGNRIQIVSEIIYYKLSMIN